MPFVSFSSQLVIDNATAVSNIFINEYLPACNGDCARVYLYGLYVCGSATRFDNTLEHFASNLNLSTDDILSAFTYWQDCGLVQILSLNPIEIKYLPIKSGNAKIKKYTAGKYADFNAQIQAIVEGRMITPSEFAEYYSFLESFHVEPAALIMIAKYCANLKGANVGHAYILTVAKNWAYSGIKTTDAVNEKLETERGDTATVTKILKTLGLKRAPEPADFELFTKWTKKLGYPAETILDIAKSSKGSINKLDNLLLKYFELKLFEPSEIKTYEQKKHDLTALAFAVNKKIGVFYENVESIIETYLVNWQLKGFDDETILSIADFCFKSGIRKLEGMDAVLSKFYKMGVTTPSAIDGFIAEKIAADKTIKKILEKVNITREPSQIDRDFYKTWTTAWGFLHEIIDYTATLAADKVSPMQYMNKILSSFHENKITTLEQAKSQSNNLISSVAMPQKQFIRHSYSDGELNRLFSNLDEVEL